MAPDLNEWGSILITSNRCVVEWGGAFSGPVVATAILDRLLDYSIVIPFAVTATRFVKASFRPIAEGRNDAQHQLKLQTNERVTVQNMRRRPCSSHVPPSMLGEGY
ncbi:MULTISPECIES: ATP-binding protein [unclassified Mesorhizobium]|nr:MULTISPECIES: ATP-binding protein [unclassified Mesorhizobium]